MCGMGLHWRMYPPHSYSSFKFIISRSEKCCKRIQTCMHTLSPQMPLKHKLAQISDVITGVSFFSFSLVFLLQCLTCAIRWMTTYTFNEHTHTRIISRETDNYQVFQSISSAISVERCISNHWLTWWNVRKRDFFLRILGFFFFSKNDEKSNGSRNMNDMKEMNEVKFTLFYF